MARKFKRRLAPKTNKRKTDNIFSIELIRKEYKERFFSFWNKLISKAKVFKI